MTDCVKIQEMISAMLDGELSEKEKCAIEEHIAFCPECAAMYADFAALSTGLSDSFAEVPATLHDKIMKGVRTAPAKKRPLLITLRPYMSAAACLVVIVGAVFAIRDSGIIDLSRTSDSTAAYSTPASMPAAQAPAASADVYSFETAEEECATESGIITDADNKAYNTNGRNDSSTTDEPAACEPESPAEEPAEKPEDAPADGGLDCDYPTLEPWEIELRGAAYPPGTEIDWALLTVYEGVETVDIRYVSDVAALCELLRDAPAEAEPEAIPRDPTALLELQCGSKYYILKLYAVGEGLIVETSEGYYLAVGTAEEFLCIK